MQTPQLALKLDLQLGESPIWSPREKALYWLDCVAPAIHRLDPQTLQHKQISLPCIVSALALCASGNLLVTTEQGYAFVNFQTGELTHLNNPYQKANVIFNDGRCDRRGRFWAGTASKDWVSPIGKLFRLDHDVTATEMDSGFILSNGLGFSPDDKIFYFTDFAKNTIYAYAFDIDAGTIHQRRAFITIPDSAGHPDGMTVDAEGHLWVALWDGGKIHRYDHRGQLVSSIAMPTPRPTSVAFGGEDLSILYITSARMGLSDTQLQTYPLSGSLFMLQTDTRGVEEVAYRGG